MSRESRKKSPREQLAEEKARRLAQYAKQEEDRRQKEVVSRTKLTGFEISLLKKFRSGMKTFCSEAIWNDLRSWYKEIFSELGTNPSEERIAARLGFNRTGVTRGGSLSLEVLITAVTDLGRELNELSNLPPKRERFAAGYVAAIKHASLMSSPLEEAVIADLSPEMFVAAVSIVDVISTPDKIEEYFANPDEEPDWDQIADDARIVAAKRLDIRYSVPEEIAEVPPVDGEMAKSIHTTWSKYAIVCLRAIPRQWYRWAKD